MDPDIGDSIDYVTLQHAHTGEPRKMVLLSGRDEETDETSVQKLRHAKQHQKYGKLTPRLADRLAQAAPSWIDAEVWYDPGADTHVKPHFLGSLAEAYQWSEGLTRDRASRREATVRRMEAAVQALGGVVTGRNTALPVLSVSVPASALASLGTRPEVHGIDLSSLLRPVSVATDPYQSLIDADDEETRETFTKEEGESPRWRGAGVRVGTHEVGDCGVWKQGATPTAFAEWTDFQQRITPGAHGCGSKPDGEPCDNQPNGGLACSNGGGHCRSGLCMKDHETHVASFLGARRMVGSVWERRNATEMRYHHANGGTATYADKMNWLVWWGVHLVNDSETGERDPVANAAVRNSYVTITKAADNNTALPVKCHENSLCVGNAGINNGTPAYTDSWKYDPNNVLGHYTMSSSTAWKDDTSHLDAEKPDVVGIGGGNPVPLGLIASGGTEGTWDQAWGTSYAAPSLGGMIAILQQYAPSLAIWPEAIRPLMIVAAAFHNITGNRLSRNANYPPGNPDEWDGAGVPTASLLRSIVDLGNYRTMALTPAVFDVNRHYYPSPTITLLPGHTLRAALGWTYCVQNSTNLLAADFDLRLKLGGATIDASLSYTNSLEMLEYTNPYSTPVQVQLEVAYSGTWQTCNGSQTEYAGLAWVKYSGTTVVP